MQAEAILDSWRAWDVRLHTRPELVRDLGGGRSNHSFLLASGNMRMALRINAAQDLLPDHARTSEARIWQAASEAGIAPPLLYAGPDGVFLVSAYIENELPQNPEHNEKIVGKALHLLQRCHQLDIHAPAIDYAAHIDGYWQIIEERELDIAPALHTQRESMLLLIEDIISESTATGLCHHDPVVENFVGGPGKLYLIDWEYAAHGLPVIDYAALGVEWGIDDAIITEHAGTDTELLSAAKEFYRYQCSLWEAISQRCHSGLDPESI